MSEDSHILRMAIARCATDADGCLIWPGAMNASGDVPGATPSLRVSGRPTVNLARLAYFGVVNPDRKRLVIRTCGKNRCLCKAHMKEVGSAKRDKNQPHIRRGLYTVFGTKLTDELRSEIVALHKQGLAQREIAAAIGISQSTISRFLRWRFQ